MTIKEIKAYEKLEQRNLQLFNWLNESQIENANMRDRLEELGELDDLIKDGSVKDLFTSFQEQQKEIKPMSKQYEIEIKSTTYRTFYVKADSMDDAINKAEDQAWDDEEISRAWCDNMEVNKGWEQDEQEAN